MPGAGQSFFINFWQMGSKKQFEVNNNGKKSCDTVPLSISLAINNQKKKHQQ
jgi:hypothetical protein